MNNDLNTIKNFDFDSLAVEDEAKFERKITEEEMGIFESLTGDKNPLHSDAGYARSKGFGGRVVYGMLAASFFSTLVGMYLPGKRCLYLSQDLIFKEPLIDGDTIKVTGRIKQKVESLKILVIETRIFKDDGTLVIDGEAKVKVI